MPRRHAFSTELAVSKAFSTDPPTEARADDTKAVPDLQISSGTSGLRVASAAAARGPAGPAARPRVHKS